MRGMHPHKRQPDETRRRLLQAAFSEIHENGFRSASVDNILAETNVTKGALYYHFKNKAELGYAVLDELIRPWIEDMWRSLLEADDPIDAAIDMLATRGAEIGEDALRLGCPFNNLAQEMSPVDAGFRARLQGILDDWHRALTRALAQGQARGIVREDIDPAAAAAFLIGGFEGCVGMAKTAQSLDMLKQGVQGMMQHLESLRPPAHPNTP
jgi:AcrR family transcriptional regulator